MNYNSLQQAIDLMYYAAEVYHYCSTLLCGSIEMPI